MFKDPKTLETYERLSQPVMTLQCVEYTTGSEGSLTGRDVKQMNEGINNKRRDHSCLRSREPVDVNERVRTNKFPNAL